MNRTTRLAGAFGIVALVPLAASTAACSSAAPHAASSAAAAVDVAADGTTTFTDTDDGAEATVATGASVVVKLTSHGDGGYLWSVVDSGGLGDPVHTRIPGPPGQVGNFGFDVFTWSTTGAADGAYVLQLVDKQPFGNDPGTPFSVTAHVAGAIPAPTPAPLALDDASNGGAFAACAGAPVVAKLTSHGDGGYVWDSVDSGGLGDPKHTTIPGPPGQVGNFGFDVFTWSTTGAQPGDLFNLQLVDKRPFGNDPGTLYWVSVSIADCGL